jgi:hypothetical protein
VINQKSEIQERVPMSVTREVAEFKVHAPSTTISLSVRRLGQRAIDKFGSDNEEQRPWFEPSHKVDQAGNPEE